MDNVPKMSKLKACTAVKIEVKKGILTLTRALGNDHGTRVQVKDEVIRELINSASASIFAVSIQHLKKRVAKEKILSPKPTS